MISVTSSRSVSDCYNVNWKSQQSHILEGIRNLCSHDGVLLTDVTLACDGEYIQAHKIVLSICSSFFKDLFEKNRVDKSNTIIIMGNVNARNMRYLLRFMYEGKVEIPSKHIDSFLQAGNLLKIEGLCKEEKEVEQIKPLVTRQAPTAGPCNTFTISVQTKQTRFNQNQDEDNPETSFPLSESDNEGGGAPNDSEENEPSLSPIEMKAETFHDSDINNLGNNEEIKLKRRRYFKSRPRPKTSVAWKFFTPNATNTEAQCKLCKDSRLILKTKAGGTTGLLRHLLQAHPGVIIDLHRPKTQYFSPALDQDDKNEVDDKQEETREMKNIINDGNIAMTDKGTSRLSISNRNTSSIRKARRSRKKRSFVWKFFTPNSDHTRARCKLCIDNPYVIKIPVSGTSGLIRHLQCQHNGAYNRAPGPRYVKAKSASESCNSNSERTSASVSPASKSNLPDDFVEGKVCGDEDLMDQTTSSNAVYHDLLKSSFNMLNPDN